MSVKNEKEGLTRDIKFRGLHDGTWVYGNLRVNNGGDYFIVFDFEDYVHGLQVVPESVSEYTGRRDRHGEGIYEKAVVCVPYIDCIFGDLVGKDIDKDFKFVVRYIKGSFVLSHRDRGNICLSEFEDKDMEIVGNILDNPELAAGD